MLSIPVTSMVKLIRCNLLTVAPHSGTSRAPDRSQNSK